MSNFPSTRAGRTVTAIEVKSGRSRDTRPGLSAFADAFKPTRKLLVETRTDVIEGIVAIVTGDTGRPVVIGHLCLEPSTPGEVEMAIAVADAWHRRGVGRALLAAGIAWARRHGLAR